MPAPHDLITLLPRIPTAFNRSACFCLLVAPIGGKAQPERGRERRSRASKRKAKKKSA